MFTRAITLALRQMTEPRTLRLVVLVAAITLGLFALAGIGAWRLLTLGLAPALSGWIGPEEAAALALVLTLLLGWFLFRTVAMAVMGLFTDGVIAAVEESHYPEAAARAVPVSFMRGLRLGLRSAARAIGWNLLAAPLYLALLITGIGTLALMLLINAALIGRDLELMVASRHPDGSEPPLTQRQRWLLGLATAVMFLLPIANLIAPLFGAALAVHMHHLRKDDRS